MNKLLKSEILLEIYLAFGTLIFLLLLLFKFNTFSYVVFGITIVGVVAIVLYQSLYIQQYNKEYVKNAKISNGIYKKNSNKILRYKQDTLCKEISYLVCSPIFMMDIGLVFFLFKDSIVEDEMDEYLLYFILLVAGIAFTKSIITTILNLIKLKSIDIELDNNDYQTIDAIPTNIKLLCYGRQRYRNYNKIGYGVEFSFGKLKLVGLVEFPYTSYYHMRDIVKEDLMGKKYKLTYLKTSKVIVDLDSRVINTLR